jgi:NhaP-type Na+/H+ or K+/H+ antiporter
MVAVTVFAVVLLLAVLISELARRSVLSTAVLFLVAGFLVGDGMLGLLPLTADVPVVRQFAELALFSVLFTDGMQAGVRDLGRAWRLPARALLLGMPLTMAGTAVFAHYVAGLPWTQAWLVGAVLSPTDPVFAAAIVGRSDVPRRLRLLLNVESGVNDGLALPVVIVLLAVVSEREADPLTLLEELALGVALGVAIPWVAIKLERLRFFQAADRYQPLYAFAIGLLVFGAGSLLHANLFLAAFAGGVTVATVAPEVRRAFHDFGDTITELLKLAALLVFGALMSPELFAEIPLGGYLFALLALLVVRPSAIGLALLGSRIAWREWVAAAWFGPKGFASVVYGLLILTAGVPGGEEMYHLIALVVVASILAHSSTDVLVARWFREEGAKADAVPASGDPGAGAAGGPRPHRRRGPLA